MLVPYWTYCGPPLPSRAARKVPKKSSNHFVGQMTFGEERGRGQCLVFESKLEHDVALCLIYRPGVVDVLDQVGPVHYVKVDGRPGRHFLDFVAVEEGGRRTGVVVKPWRHAERTAFRQDVKRVAAAASAGTVDRIVVATERSFSSATLAFRSQLHAARHQQPEFDTVLERAVVDVVEPTTVRDLLERIGLEPQGYHAVLRQIRFGRLRLLDPGLAKMSSLVVATGSHA